MNIKAVVAVAALVCVALAPVIIAAEGVEGTWEFKNQTQARTQNATMTISKNAEGKLSGMWSTQRGENTLSDISFENGKVKFVQTANFGGQEMKTTYEGTIDGTKMTGKGQTARFGEFTFEGTLQGQAKKGADAIVGEWQITVNMPARENVEKLTITKGADGTLAGKWEGQRGESTISGMKFEGGKLTFKRTSNFGGREMIMDYEGTVEGDKITGKFTSERGDREANATRAGAATKPAEEKKPDAGKAESPKKAEPNKPK